MLPKKKAATKEYRGCKQNCFGSGKKMRLGIMHLPELGVLDRATEQPLNCFSGYSSQEVILQSVIVI
jgi:hypothetical protein